MVHFERNSKLLAEYDKPLYDKLQKLEFVNQFPNVQVGFGQNEQGVVDNIVMNMEGKLFVAGTEKEADMWINCVDTNAHVLVIFGLGLGYHIEKLIDKYPDKHIYVIEPDKRILGHALHLRDMEKIFRNCTLWVDEPILNVKMRLYEMITHPLARGIAVVPFFTAVYQEYAEPLTADIQRMLNDWCVMLNTKRTLAEKWYANRFENIKIPTVNLASLIGKFKDIPGIVVGAGPSLQSQLEMLRSLQGKAVIIAASTAAQILKTHGIKPNFMIAIDQDPVTSGALHENMDGDIPLIFDGQVAQNSLKYKGKKFQALLNVNRYSGMVIPTLPVLESGPSVANVALDTLYKFGCSPILIVGMDMSYTNNKLYCEGTLFNKDINTSEALMKMIGIDGKECVTEPSFLAMRNWFEEYVSRVKPPAFNCTVSGVPITGLEHKALGDFDFSKEYNIEEIIDQAYYIDDGVTPTYSDSSFSKVNQEILDELQQIKQSIITTKAILPHMSTWRSWFLLDEFISVEIYLQEIRCEFKIASGKCSAEDAIKHFHNKRTEAILSKIEVLTDLLRGV